MKYRPDIDQVIDRYRRFYACGELGAILIHVFVPPDGVVPCALCDYGFPDPDENARYLADYVADRECFFRGRLAVRDDYVPDISLYHGIGIHSAYVAGEIRFGVDTSWATPVIERWDDLAALALSEDNPWFRVLRQAAEITVERLGDAAGIATFYHFSPLDMANALRGNQLFYDLYDAPEPVVQLLDFCTQAVIWLETQLWPIVGDLRGGVPLWGSWLPGHALMMSEDVANLCRASFYPRWAAPWTQRVIDHFDGALIHNHALGMHEQAEIANLRDLVVLQISEDPNQPRPVARLAELIAETGGVPLQISCRPHEIPRAVEIAQQGRVILQTNAPDPATANEIVAYVRAHSRIGA